MALSKWLSNERAASDVRAKQALCGMLLVVLEMVLENSGGGRIADRLFEAGGDVFWRARMLSRGGGLVRVRGRRLVRR